MMESYKYKSHRYYIDTSGVAIPDVCGLNPINIIVENAFSNDGILNKYVDYDNEQKIIDFHFSLYHELNHYYQDLAMPSSLCESIILSHLENYAISQITNEDIHYPIFDEINKNQWRYLDGGYVLVDRSKKEGWHSSQDLGRVQVYNYLYNRLFRTKIHGGLEYTLTYEDLLESHAEIKSLFDFYYECNDEKSSEFVHSAFEKYNKIPISILKDSNNDIRFKFENITNKYERKYHIVRAILFYYVFSAEKRNLFNIKENIIPLLNFYQNYIPVHSGHKLYPIMEHVSWIDYFLLLAIEISLTIPAPSYYLDNILDQKYNDQEQFEKEMFKYTPPDRFMKVLKAFETHDSFFWENENLRDITFGEVYNFIANLYGWCSYTDIIHSYEKDFHVLYGSNLDFYTDIQYRLLVGKGMSKVAYLGQSTMSMLKTCNAPIIIKDTSTLHCYILNNNDNIAHYYSTNKTFEEILTQYQMDNFFGTTYMRQMSEKFLQTFVIDLCRKDFSSYLLYGKKKKCECPLYVNCLAANNTCTEIQEPTEYRACMNMFRSRLPSVIKLLYS